MNKKGQGALEYLLLIGGAVLIAAVVLTLLVGLGGEAGAGTEQSVKIANCVKFGEAQCNSALYGSTNCTWSATSLDASLVPIVPAQCVPCTAAAAAVGADGCTVLT